MWKMLSKGTLLGRECFGDAKRHGSANSHNGRRRRGGTAPDKGEWSGVCSRPLPYIQVVQESFYREKQNLIWDNRMIDNRLAVAQLASEISRIMEMVAEVFDTIFQVGRPSYRRSEKGP